MQITVFGASGEVGKLVVAQALERGHTVVAFTHSHNPFSDQSHLTVLHGDINDASSVAQALRDSEAVISTLGSWHTKSKDILTKGMQTIIPAMEAQGLRRIVTLTGSGALWSQDRLNLIGKSGHVVLGLIAPKILKDGESHLRQLEASKLDWTCLRSPVMRPKGPLVYSLSTKLGSVLATIPRAAAANALLDLVTTDQFVHQAPVIARAES